ncbi:MAG: dihydrodipicolinate reductase C-terminal domain-containing protein [Thermoanaerobaculia bacterium]
MKMKALLVGYGKMGKAVEVVLLQRGHRVVEKRRGREEGGFPGGNRAGGDDAAVCDLAFEFTAPDAARHLVPFLLSKRIPVLSGTTGWDTTEAVRLATEHSVPFLHSPNFSLGVAAMRRAAAALSTALAPFRGFQPGIVERHHAAKKDAPSGTARALASDVARVSGRQEIPIVSLRQGGTPGEHALFFEGEDETLELVHRARSRAIFAQGAVSAGEWMVATERGGPLTFEEFFAAMSEAGVGHGP